MRRIERPNLIFGIKPEFGNWLHIQANILHDKIMSGEMAAFSELEWVPASYNYLSERKFFHCCWEEASVIIDYWTCPYCKKSNLVASNYEGGQLHYESLVRANDNHSTLICDRCQLRLLWKDIGYYVES